MAVITTGSNTASLQAQRPLARATQSLRSALEHLSSGLRITRASDDAAGLAVSSLLNVDTRVYTQGVRNLNDGISLLNIAESSLINMSDILVRLKELAQSAANGTLTLGQRRALDAEAGSLTNEYNRLSTTTNFNGLKLIDGNFGSLTLQAGYGPQQPLNFSLGSQIQRRVGDGTFQSVISAAPANTVSDIAVGDLNKDGYVDVVQADGATVSFGQADGTFTGTISLDGDPFNEVEIADINNDGNLDFITNKGMAYYNVFLGDGRGNFTEQADVNESVSDPRLVDVNGDGLVDLVGRDSNSPTYLQVGINQGNGSFNSLRTTVLPSNFSSFDTMDVDGNGVAEIVTVTGSTFSVYRVGNDGTATRSSSTTISTTSTWDMMRGGDMNHDGYADLVLVENSGAVKVAAGNGNGTFQTPVTAEANGGIDLLKLADVNSDGYLDILNGNSTAMLKVILNKGDGTYTTSQTIQGGVEQIDYFDIGDVNGDGVPDIIEADDDSSGIGIGTMLGTARTTTNTSRLNLLTQSSARSALTSISSLLTKVDAELGSIGAFQSRVGTDVQNLQITSLNLRDASSRITDVDVASESASLVRAQILQQSASAVLGQANQMPGRTLQLLRRL